MYNSFDKSLTEFTYPIERISIVTKEFLNHLDERDYTYKLVCKIYKSAQSINYEFVKLCYSIRSDENLSINLSRMDSIEIPVDKIHNIIEFKEFINSSNESLKNPLNFICESSKDYSLKLQKELVNYIKLINELNEKITDDN